MKKLILISLLFIAFCSKAQTLTRMQKDAIGNSVILRDYLLYEIFKGGGTTAAPSGLGAVRNSPNLVELRGVTLSWMNYPDTIKGISIANTGTTIATVNSQTISAGTTLDFNASGFNGYYTPTAFTISIPSGGNALIIYNK